MQRLVLVRATWLRLALAVVVLVCIPVGQPRVFAQRAGSQPRAATRALTGLVLDVQGASVPGAEVTVADAAGNRLVTTDADGRFRVELSAGRYNVRVEHGGFQPAAREVLVEGDRDATLDIVLTVGDIDEAVTVHAPAPTARRSTTATKTDTPLLETPQSVTVIPAEQVRDQGSPTLQEVVRYTAGVRNELYGVDNRGDWISLRGSDESTTLLDGMRLPLTGWYGVVRNEPFAFERIEVLRGPSSIIAGQNDPGGVLNLVSKRPLAERRREVGVRTGSFNRREFLVDFAGPLTADGTWLYRLVGVGRDTDTQVQHADEQRLLLAPSLTWRPRRGQTFTVYGDYQHDRTRNTNAFLGLDGTLRAAPHGPIPRDVFIGEPEWDRYGGSRRRGGYETNVALGGTWRVRHNLRHDRVSGLMKSMYAAWWDGFVDSNGQPAADGRYMGREWYLYDDRSTLTASEVLVDGRHRTGGIEHTLLVGVDGMRHDAQQTSESGAGTPLDVYTPTYGTFAEPSLAGASPVRNDIRRIGMLAQDQMRFGDRLRVRAGVRRDRVSNEVVGGERQIDWATSTNVGAVYTVLGGLAPYVSYSESFNPVSGTDVEGRSFRPKRGAQVEAGLKWEGASLPVQATVAWYALKERNHLVNDPRHVGYSLQIGEARVRGAELEAKAELAAWTVLGSYTFTRARASAASFGGNLDPTQQLEGIPEHMASLWAVHTLSRGRLAGARLGGGLREIGRIGDGTGLVFVPRVTLLDALASYDTGPWRFSLNVNNLTDKPYIATCLARGDCWFGVRRTATLSATFRY